MKTFKLPWRLFPLAISIVLITGCVQSEQQYHLNKDGSGKVRIKADLTVNPKLSNEEKPLSHEDSVKMYKKIEEIVHESKGIEAWDSLDYTFHKDGKLTFSGIAYFPDITELDLEEIPIVPVNEFNENHIKWGNKPSEEVQDKFPDKKASKASDTLSTEEIMDKIKTEFDDSQQFLQMAMSFFELDATYHFAHKIKSVDNVEKVGDRSIKFSLEGDKIMKGFEELMDNNEKLQSLVEDKGVSKFNFNNPHILKAAYPDRSFMKVTFRSGFLSPKAKDAFDYEKTVEAINPKMPRTEAP